MKIIYFITGLGNGGAEKQLFNLSTNLPKTYSIQIISLLGGEYEGKFKEKNIRVHVLNRKKVNILKSIKKYQSIIQKEQPNIIHSYLPHANILSKVVKLFTKTNYKLINSVRGKESTTLQQIGEKFTSKQSDLIITNSQSLRKHVLKNINSQKNKIKVIPNGYNFNSVKVTNNNKKKSFQIITVANFTKEKDYHTNINTVEEVIKQRKDVQFIYVGDGTSIKQEIEERVVQKKLSKYVSFLGLRKDVPKLLKQSDIFFLPTISEGQSNAIIESMYYGCPVITTNIDANKEIIKESKTGLLTPIKSPFIMAKKIISLLDDTTKRNKIIDEAKKEAKKYTMVKMVKAYQEAYTSILTH